MQLLIGFLIGLLIFACAYSSGFLYINPDGNNLDLKEQIAILQEHLRQSISKIKVYEKELSDKNKALERMKEQLDKTKQLKNEQDVKLREIKQIKNKQDIKLKEMEQIKNKRDIEVQDLLKKQQVKINELSLQHATMQNLNRNYMELMKSKRIEIQNLQDQLCMAQQSNGKAGLNKSLIDLLKAELKTKNKAIEKSIEQVAMLEEQLNLKGTEIQDLEDKIDMVNTEQQLVEKKVEKLRDDCIDKDITIDNLTKDFTDLKNKHDLLQQEMETLDEEQLLNDEIEKRFHNMLECAEREIFISSPWVSKSVKKQVLPILKKAVDKGVTIHIVYGIKDLEKKNPLKKPRSKTSDEQIEEYKKELGSFLTVEKSNTHTKVCICDDCYLTGSYNFLSFTYNYDNYYNNYYGYYNYNAETNDNWSELCYYGKSAKKLQELKQNIFM